MLLKKELPQPVEIYINKHSVYIIIYKESHFQGGNNNPQRKLNLYPSQENCIGQNQSKQHANIEINKL